MTMNKKTFKLLVILFLAFLGYKFFTIVSEQRVPEQNAFSSEVVSDGSIDVVIEDEVVKIEEEDYVHDVDKIFDVNPDKTTLFDRFLGLFSDFDDPSPETPDEVELDFAGALASLSYWDTWSWEDKFVKISVSDVDAASGIVSGVIALPESHSQVGNNRAFVSKCIYADTVFYVAGSGDTVTEPIEEPNPTDSILNNVEVGDDLYAYCLEEACSRIGNACVVQKL